MFYINIQCHLCRGTITTHSATLVSGVINDTNASITVDKITNIITLHMCK